MEVMPQILLSVPDVYAFKVKNNKYFQRKHRHKDVFHIIWQLKRIKVKAWPSVQAVNIFVATD